MNILRRKSPEPVSTGVDVLRGTLKNWNAKANINAGLAAAISAPSAWKAHSRPWAPARSMSIGRGSTIASGWKSRMPEPARTARGLTRLWPLRRNKPPPLVQTLSLKPHAAGRKGLSDGFLHAIKDANCKGCHEDGGHAG